MSSELAGLSLNMPADSAIFISPAMLILCSRSRVRTGEVSKNRDGQVRNGRRRRRRRARRALVVSDVYLEMGCAAAMVTGEVDCRVGFFSG